MGKKKAAASPAKPARESKKKTSDGWPADAPVRVRMYRHGLGDCFLLTFPRPGKSRDFQVLIDCGVIQGTPTPEGEPSPLRRVVDDLKVATDFRGTPTVDVLVATHEHWDHLSGFNEAREDFDAFDIKQVWLAWTEDPDDEDAKTIRAERGEKLNALRLGAAHLKADLTATEALGADGRSGPAAEDYRRVVEVLTFFGVDPDEPLSTDGLGAAAKTPRHTIGDAMGWCRDRPTDHRKFFRPGAVVDLGKEVAGLKVFVLGPPTDLTQLHKDLPTKRGKETYEEKEGSHLTAAARAFFGADVGHPDPHAVQSAADRSAPFDRKYRIEMETAANTDFFRTHYFGSGAGDTDGWRRIDAAGLDEAAAFALQLDSDTNNTSLALAFELGDGRVLLFPGDAQVGNWESWHADPDGRKRVWEVGGRSVTAPDLLAKTVVYKVGHHCSHNATLREQGLELMNDDRLVALVPVDTHVAHDIKKWGRMPFVPLVEALNRKARGRVVLADRRVSDTHPTAPFPGRIKDADADIVVEGAGGRTVRRPLYVDYFLPDK